MNMKRKGFVFISLIILGGFSVLNGQEEQPKKIAVASEGKTVDSRVGSQGARCSWLLFFDEKGEIAETLENPYRETRGDAGIKCAGLLADRGITIFVAGHVGDKFAAALERKNISFVSFSRTVKEAIVHVLEDPDWKTQR